jgi:hypothetical protein
MGLLESKWLKVNVKTKEFTCHPPNCISHPPSSKLFFQKFQICFGAKTSPYILKTKNKIIKRIFVKKNWNSFFLDILKFTFNHSSPMLTSENLKLF